MPYWEINVNNVSVSRQSVEYFSNSNTQSARKVRLNAAAVPQAVPCACKKKKRKCATARFGLPINGKQGCNNSWVVCCFFSVCRVPFCLLDIYTDGEELCVKSRPKVQCLHRFKKKKQNKNRQTCTLFPHLFHLILANKTMASVKVYQHWRLHLFFFFLSPISCFETRDNWFPLCHRWCFSVKVHKGVDGAITATAIEWFWMVFSQRCSSGIFQDAELPSTRMGRK